MRSDVAAIAIAAGAALVGISLYFYSSRAAASSKSKAKVKKVVTFVDQVDKSADEENTPVPESSVKQETEPESEKSIGSSADGSVVVVEILSKLLESAKATEACLKEHISLVESKEERYIDFNQPKAVSIIVKAMQSLNQVREEIREKYDMGEEELKEAISENESRDEVSTLTHELSVVKAAIADKSRQVSSIEELDKIWRLYCCSLLKSPSQEVLKVLQLKLKPFRYNTLPFPLIF